MKILMINYSKTCSIFSLRIFKNTFSFFLRTSPFLRVFNMFWVSLIMLSWSMFSLFGWNFSQLTFFWIITYFLLFKLLSKFSKLLDFLKWIFDPWKGIFLVWFFRLNSILNLLESFPDYLFTDFLTFQFIYWGWP